ncbi:DNA cytosine methyltransferase [Eleftheria terrae]|uniref:DNA cytosine methyltransferase n=1 Tax=Eleftheria terrae TaxID=1597781 RepID=UPI003441F89C
MNELALFAGAGGGLLGGHQLGWRTVCAVELDPYAAGVLVARQNDGLLPAFPVWDDVRTFDGRRWRGCIDVVSGGFPCQDVSVAGRGAGIDGERSGLWAEMARIVGEVRPRHVFVENSPALRTRGLGRVLGDLAALGYDCRWTVLGAADVGAPHRRDRFWLVATDAHGTAQRHEPQSVGQCRGAALAGDNGAARIVADPDRERQSQSQGGQRNERRWLGDSGPALANAARLQPGWPQRRAEWQRAGRGHPSEPVASDADGARLEERRCESADPRAQLKALERADWWLAEPDVGRVAHGVAARVDRLKALGNGQVPLCAATAWRLLTADIIGP